MLQEILHSTQVARPLTTRSVSQSNKENFALLLLRDTTIHNPVRDHNFTSTRDTCRWRSTSSEVSHCTRLGGHHRFAVQIDGWPRMSCVVSQFGLWRGREGVCLWCGGKVACLWCGGKVVCLWCGGKGVCLWCNRERFLVDSVSASWLTFA